MKSNIILLSYIKKNTKPKNSTSINKHIKNIIIIYLIFIPHTSLIKAQTSTQTPEKPPSYANTKPQPPISPQQPPRQFLFSSSKKSTSSALTQEVSTPKNDTTIEKIHQNKHSTISQTKLGTKYKTKIKRHTTKSPSNALYKPTLRIEAHYMDFNYEEPSLMKEKGQFPGLHLGYKQPFGTTFTLSLSIVYYQATINYNGQLQSLDRNGIPHKTKGKNSLLYGLIHLEKPFLLNKLSITPFLGVGYRQWIDDLSKDPYGYKRKTEYVYSPIGFKTSYAINSRLSITLLGQYNYFIKGKNKSYLSKFGTVTDPNNPLRSISYKDLTVTQNKGTGYFFALTSSLKLTTNILFNIKTYYQKWNIENSTKSYFDGTNKQGNPKKYFGYEPKNNTEEIGISTDLCYIWL